MSKNEKMTRTLKFIVSLNVPRVASVYAVRDYIQTAIRCEGGQYPKDDPLFSANIKRVSVKREGKLESRQCESAEPIELSGLISQLQMVESQIRQKGSIPEDQPLKVPVKVTADFGPYRHSLVYVTAKPRLVLLHYVKED